MSEHFAELQAAYRSGQLSPERIRLEAKVSPPVPEDILNLDHISSAAWQQLAAEGRAAVAQGQVAAVILAGGMATRFDFDAPKGLFPILPPMTFLEIKVRSLCAEGIPLLIMTSFHTHAAIEAFLNQHDWFGFRDKISLFQQFRLPRISPDGEIRTVNGETDYATAGHGDFVEALQESGLLTDFLARGGKYLLFSNIDNLGASFEPVLLGLHLQQQAEMSIEVAAKAPGDKGGAPARVNDRLQLVEEFLFPADFDQNQIQVFNTATYIFSAEALQGQHPLPWYVVKKQVDGQPVLQFEHLAGDLSRSLRISCVQVPRETRFLPVKQLDDAEAMQPLLRKKYARLLRG